MPQTLKPARRPLLESALYESLVAHGFDRHAASSASGCTVRTLRKYITRWRAEGRDIPAGPTPVRPSRGHKAGCRCTPCRHALQAAKRATTAKDLRPPNISFCTKCGRSNTSKLTRPNGECEKCATTPAPPKSSHCSVCGALSYSLVMTGQYLLCRGCALDKPHAR